MSKLTANECARSYLTREKDKGRTRIPQTELYTYVARTVDQERAVVSGTLDGAMGNHTLVGSDWYCKDWKKNKLANGRIVHCVKTGNKDAVLQREENYDFPEKHRIIEKVMGYLPSKGRPRFLTFAGAEGHCVQAAVKKNPNTRVENIEYKRDRLERWQSAKLSLPGVTSTDHRCTFRKFVQTPGFQTGQYDLIFADLMGYMSETLYMTLTAINELKNTKIFVLTTQHIFEGFRNGSNPFQDKLREAYRYSHDTNADSITNCLSNYQHFDSDVYHKDVGSMYMEVLFYRLKTPEEIEVIPSLDRLHSELLKLAK